MKTKKLKRFLEENGFKVHLTKQNNAQCAEVETWTSAGVNVTLWLCPFTIESLEQAANNFDIDSEIDINRQCEKYREVFSVKASVKDFKDHKNRLKKIMYALIYSPTQNRI